MFKLGSQLHVAFPTHGVLCVIRACYNLCKRAAKLLVKAAAHLAREGKSLVVKAACQCQNRRQHTRFVRTEAEAAAQDQDDAQNYVHSYEKQLVLDFVERQTASPLLGISGMRGVGKTTLLRFVRDSYAYACGSNPYRHSVFFVGAGCGTGRTAVARLQYALAVNIGLGPPPQVSDAARIISTSLKGKPFLLLLDDVRERLDLAAVGLPMPLGHRQKVIFTTRNQAICSEMGCAMNSIHMECLAEDDAWDLFKDKAGEETINAHPHINHLANKMAAECLGLPSTWCALGRAMSTKRDVKEWRFAYDALKRKQPPDNEIQEMDDEGYSYLHLLEYKLQDSAFF